MHVFRSIFKSFKNIFRFTNLIKFQRNQINVSINRIRPNQYTKNLNIIKRRMRGFNSNVSCSESVFFTKQIGCSSEAFQRGAPIVFPCFLAFAIYYCKRRRCGRRKLIKRIKSKGVAERVASAGNTVLLCNNNYGLEKGGDLPL